MCDSQHMPRAWKKIVSHKYSSSDYPLEYATKKETNRKEEGNNQQAGFSAVVRHKISYNQYSRDQSSNEDNATQESHVRCWSIPFYPDEMQKEYCCNLQDATCQASQPT